MKRTEMWGVGLLAFLFILFAPRARADTAYDVSVTPRDGATVRLHVTEAGRGPPVVVLHGLGASSYAFRSVAAALAPRHRVIRIDLKGFGRSEKPFDDRYRPIDQAQLVAAFLRQQRLSDVTLIGHSFGGAVALLTTLMMDPTEARRIRRMVLLNAPAFSQDLPRTQRLLTLPVLPYVALTVMPPILNTRAALQTARRASSPPTDQDAIAYADALYDAGGRHALIASARAVAEIDTTQIEPHYRRLRQPVLLVWCRHDTTVPLANGLRLRDALPRARLAVLEQCTHMPHEEQPIETEALIAGFLRAR